jgi:hypothetical protein
MPALFYTRVIVLAIAAAAMSACASPWTCSLDAIPAQFDIINVVAGVNVTSQMVGVVKPLSADQWLTSNEPTLTLWRHPSGPAITRRLATDGRFSLSVPRGQYCFLATANGFSATAGRVVVTRSAPSRPLTVLLTIAN